jgi:acyl-CoA hydrolase
MTTAAAPLEHQFTELVLPHDANHYGTLFGPNALALMGKAAFLAAARHTRQAVVMASATRVEFLKPVPVGALLHVHGRVTRVGTCSMSVRVRAHIDAAPGDVMRGAFEMVAVDAQGRPCAVTVLQALDEPVTA